MEPSTFVLGMMLLTTTALAFAPGCAEPPTHDDEEALVASEETLKAPPVAPDWTAVRRNHGYFDHTGEWYRTRGFPLDQRAFNIHGQAGPGLEVVLYNDIRPSNATETGSPDSIRARIDARAADIQDYLDTAASKGARALLQLPPEMVKRWKSESQAMSPLLDEYIARWRDNPGLAGFYVFDEPEIDQIPVETLQQIAVRIREKGRAGGNKVCFSVAYGGVDTHSPLVEVYASASPPAYDLLLMNRYPVYREYAAAGNEGDTAFEVEKLGLTLEKARLENLADNEFANLATYYDSLVAASKLARVDGQTIRTSMQAYGLRDDCAGPTCLAVRENNPRRSPTWPELLNMFASTWLVGLDGAMLYGNHLSRYDAALQVRLSNLDRVKESVFRLQAVRGPGVALRKVSNDPVIADQSPENIYARYVPAAGQPYYFLVVLRNRLGSSNARVLLNPGLKFKTIRERRFDAQGKPLATVARTASKVDTTGIARELQLTMDSYGVRIFELQP